MAKKGINKIYKEACMNAATKIPFKEFLHLYDQKKYLNAGGVNCKPVNCVMPPCPEICTANDEQKELANNTNHNYNKSKHLLQLSLLITGSVTVAYLGYKFLKS